MQPLVQLTGIARLASEGSLLTEKRRVEYRSLPTRKWLNRCTSNRVPFHWTLNPYRGCEYGCKYCYARFTHEFLEREDADAFETEIYAKSWDEAVFRRELRSVKPNQVIGLGTATDPYQPAERAFHLTRRALESLDGLRGVHLFVTTKSNLVARDADLLAGLSRHNNVCVTMTITTMRRELARQLEPLAPAPNLRIEAVARLVKAGVRTGVIASPVLPLITDSELDLESVARAAHEAGAGHFGANVLFLKPSSQRVFFPFLEERFPGLVKRYRHNFAGGAFLKGAYPERIRQMISQIRERVGINQRDMNRLNFARPPQSQMMLF